jgi:hypothetical protein
VAVLPISVLVVLERRHARRPSRPDEATPGSSPQLVEVE